ncbi:cytochrome c family protein [Phenylobacterium sp.]|uniref:c-type cytochrome n=1 Tax=Phenylobacterium sp. TaxID=1871053 RepID=UPI002DE5C481|nr:cytochrome c family protein [Phenylobacterium sp.]
MSDLTFNKIAGAVLATGLAVVGLGQLSSGVFSKEPPAKPGYAVEVAADTSEGGAAAAETPPDWGTVLPKADVAAGEQVFAKCQSCHSLTANGTGPNLTGVEGRKPGTEAGFSYSPAMQAFGGKQPIWDYEHLFEYLKNPQAYVSGTKMTFVGLKKPEDRINVIAFLHTKGSSLPIPAPNPAAAAAAAPTTGPAGATKPAAAAAAAGQPTATGSTASTNATAPAGGPAGQGKGAPGGAPDKTTSTAGAAPK